MSVDVVLSVVVLTLIGVGVLVFVFFLGALWENVRICKILRESDDA